MSPIKIRTFGGSEFEDVDRAVNEFLVALSGRYIKIHQSTARDNAGDMLIITVEYYGE